MLVDKCIAPGKTVIKKVAIEILFDLFERRDKMEIFEVILELLKNKN